jgi:hypothetical protein
MTVQTPARDAVEVTQADRDAVQAFHSIMIKRIIRGDKTLGDDQGDNGVLVQAFARHRLAAASQDYARGIEDAAKVAARTVGNHWDRIDTVEAIRSLVAAQPQDGERVTGQMVQAAMDVVESGCDINHAEMKCALAAAPKEEKQ